MNVFYRNEQESSKGPDEGPDDGQWRVYNPDAESEVHSKTIDFGTSTLAPEKKVSLLSALWSHDHSNFLLSFLLILWF